MEMSILEMQTALEWFEGLTDEKRTELIMKNNIPRTIEDRTLTNGDVLSIYRSENL